MYQLSQIDYKIFQICQNKYTHKFVNVRLMAWYVFKFVIFPFIFLTIRIVGQSAILHPGFPRSSQILFYSKLYLINFKLHSAKNSFLFTFEKAWFLLSSTTWNIFTSSYLLPHEGYLLLFTKLNWQAFPRYILKIMLYT